MGSLSYQVPAGLDISDYLTFIPKSVIVSNYTPYYIYFPDSLSYCPPWTSGAIFPLAHATRARATWAQSPFGAQTITTSPIGVTYTASISFTDDELLLSGGTSLSNPFNPAKTLYFEIGLTPAAVTPLGTIPSGSVIKSVALSGASNTAGNCIGRLTVLISDGITDVALLGIQLSTPGHEVAIQLYLDPITLSSLSLAMATWTVYVVTRDISGVVSYTYVTTISYS